MTRLAHLPHLPHLRRLAMAAALLATAAAHAGGTALNDYPTQERVMYVTECMAANPGPRYEMIAKCSCALDKLAEELSYDEYIALSTEAKSTTIGGERGAVIRENKAAQKDARRWRELQKKVQAACYVGTRIQP